MNKFLPIIFFVAVGLFKPFVANAQILSAGQDTSLCPGQNITLNASFTPGAVPSTVNLCAFGTCDDYLSTSWYPIGFTFNFYGNNYTQFLVSSNGYITFTGTPGGYSPWAIGVNLPNAGAPVNAIMAPWQDILPGAGAIIRGKLVGTAPFRKYVVEYLNVASFSCGTATCFGAQIHIYETTNIIETHIFRHQPCVGWNSGRAVHGIQNATGTVAHIVPGRNGLNAPWGINAPGYAAAPSSAASEGRRWTPTGPTAYTISTIPFAPQYMDNIAPAAGILTWYQAGVPGALGTGYSLNVSPAATTNYVVSTTYPITGGCAGVPPYVITDTVRVNMGSLPLTTSPNQTICFGDTATIYANSILPGVAYSWAPSASLTSPLTDTTNAMPTTTTTYTVSATNGGCTATATVSVNVNPLPVPTVTPINPQICEGSSVVMTAGGGVNYLWTPASGLSSTTTATTTASPVSTTTYSIIVTDANGCTDSIVNTVNFFSNPTVTASSNDPGVCLTFSTDLQANGAVNYLWTPAGSLNANNIASPVATPVVNTTYQVIGTDINGCRDTAFVDVLVYPNPVSAFTAPVTSGCQPLTANLVSNSTIASGTIAQYIWNVETMGTSGQQNPSFTFPNIGDFDVELITVSDMGCTDTLTMIDYLHSYSVPTAGFFATPNPATLGDANIEFTNTSSVDVTSSVWDMDGLATINAMNPEFEFNTADTFMVTLIVSTIHGCMDTVTSPVIVEDVSEIWIPNSFTPNNDGMNDFWFPVGRNLLNGAARIEVEVFNKWGMSVFYSTDASKTWDGNANETVTDCPQDVYVYRVYFINEKGKEFNYLGHVNIIR